MLNSISAHGHTGDLVDWLSLIAQLKVHQMRAELPVFLALIHSWKKYTFGFDIVLNARTVG